MRKPEFITFTGVDNHTPVLGMIALAEKYPIEWGVLLSPSRTGNDPRYPSWDSVFRLTGGDLRYAAHLCGDHSQFVMDERGVELPIGLLCRFSRLQINHKSPRVIPMANFAARMGARCIGQTRERFPETRRVDWLFDPSGGRGEKPSEWPEHPGFLVGYAGGINPDNVQDVLAAINANGRYWIDMESGVRTDNIFDLEKCRQVCERVYGHAGALR